MLGAIVVVIGVGSEVGRGVGVSLVDVGSIEVGAIEVGSIVEGVIVVSIGVGSEVGTESARIREQTVRIFTYTHQECKLKVEQ